MATTFSNQQFILALIAGIIAAIIGALLWLGLYEGLGAPWPAPLLIGVIVGGAVRFVAGKPRDMRPGIAACVCSVLASVAGYIMTDQMLIEWLPESYDPTYADSFRRLVQDIFFVVLIALGAWFAWMIAGPRIPSK